MLETNGHITVNERVPSQRFHRFVEEKVRDWMKEHGMDSRPGEYEIAFFDEEALDEVSCLIVIQSGPELWRSWETADNPREALLRSLQNLHLDSDEQSNDQNQVIDQPKH